MSPRRHRSQRGRLPLSPPANSAAAASSTFAPSYSASGATRFGKRAAKEDARKPLAPLASRLTLADDRCYAPATRHCAGMTRMSSQLSCLLTLLLTASGCARWVTTTKEPGNLPRARLAPDAVVLDVAFVKLPAA